MKWSNTNLLLTVLVVSIVFLGILIIVALKGMISQTAYAILFVVELLPALVVGFILSQRFQAERQADRLAKRKANDFDINKVKVMRTPEGTICEAVTALLIIGALVAGLINHVFTGGDIEAIECIAVFSLIAVVLLIVTKLFLRPLDRVNNTLKEIAEGNYSKRLKVKGSEEFRSLSENVNLMAESVEENYNKIQSIADERKQFIDSLSHEIKTPLTSVLGFAELMRMKTDLSSDEVLEYSSIIAEEAARLRSLSGKMMELVSTGNGSLEKQPVRLDELLTEISVVFEPIIKIKGVKLNVVTEPVVIMADRDLFKSLLYNLVDNAVKASPENETVSFSCKEERGFAIITVSDNGKGIAPDEQKKVFEPFYMTDKARSRKAGGAGLGLALCAEIAKKHEAVIRLKSEVNKGTAITVTVKAGGAGYDENNK